MSWIVSADRRVIDAVQEIYLRIWDWTGVTVGLLEFVIIIIAELVFNRATIYPIRLFLFAVVTIVCVVYHDQQIRFPFAHNKSAERNREDLRFLRTLLIGYDFGEMLGELVFLDWMSAIKSLLWILVWYLWCAKTREREPPEWRFLKPAMEGA